MPEDDWISKFRINGKLVVHVLITSLMLWKNLWLRTRTGSFEEKLNICLVERTTYQVHCVLIFKCSHPVSQMSTKSMWEWMHMLLQHTSYNPQSQHKLRQAIIFFSLLAQTQFCLHLFVPLLRLSHLHSWILLDTGCSSNVRCRPSPASPPAFTPWGSFTKTRAGLQKHSLCLLP